MTSCDKWYKETKEWNWKGFATGVRWGLEDTIEEGLSQEVKLEKTGMESIQEKQPVQSP